MAEQDRSNEYSRAGSAMTAREFNRRLADKIKAAISQAVDQNRTDIVGRLLLIHRAILDNDREYRQAQDSYDRRCR